ncbi:cbb3-type cytochrome c oxidase N-terminal domain-containing protein [Olleya marilimosa]|uniref:C-type cytochrome n=1 Tax=Olleya marilimosa TaxID=272164 RepID=A0ABR8LXG7_9FLAO|nr:cbb3-type cytochrome c oxidase N-terminal domain-containing protein [Olleya marilimosa]MBD3863799.1 c-type cytochrome [Olleya marilimosa]MBD3890990.1 c-type cytochrome [Olleya marilimosa]
MRHLIPSYVRVPAVFFIIFGLVEYFVDSGDKPAFLEYPIIMLFLLLVLVILIAIEGIVGSIENVLFQSLDEAGKQRYLANQAKVPQFTKVKALYAKLKGDDKPIEEEHEIILDHNYDGIKELDNNLPPWWLYSWYASMVFAVIYLFNFHVTGSSDTQYEELDNEYAQAKIEIEAYKKTAKNLVDVNSVVLLTDALDLQNGKKIFTENCIACHMADGGGGIGPNLTDKYWILGGSIKNVFQTISEGGRSGKGMVSWKKDLKPLEMAQVASYVLSLQGTTPANPKEAEGDLWQPEGAEDLEIPAEAQGTDVLEVEKSVSMNN